MKRVLLMASILAVLCLSAPAKDKAGRLNRVLRAAAEDEITVRFDGGPEFVFRSVEGTTVDIDLNHRAFVHVTARIRAHGYRYEDAFGCEYTIGVDGQPQMPAKDGGGSSYVWFEVDDTIQLEPGRHQVSLMWRPRSDFTPTFLFANSRRLIAMVY